MQKPADFIVQHRTRSTLDDKIGWFLHDRRQIFVGRFYWQTKSANFLHICHHGDCLRWVMNIYVSYLFCLLLYDVYFRSLDAEKNNASIILQSAFYCCVSVKLADIVQSRRR